MKTPFDHAMFQLDRALSIKPISPLAEQRLKNSEREVLAHVPLVMDTGEVKMIDVYRVQYNSARGPYKGGIRFHPNADIFEVRALAFWMALKCAVVGIAMGGGKGGATIDPKTLSKSELERLSRGWMKIMADVVGPQKDVPAPDVNTTPEIMAWMENEYSKITGDTSGAVITGKPIEQGGSEGRGIATALGGRMVFRLLRERLGLPEVCRVVVQGFGNAGEEAAILWGEDGHKILAVSDSKGGIYSEKGLNISEVKKYKEATGSVVNYPKATNVSNEELLLLDCDVLIPAALENQITEQNAGEVKACVIFELANGPTTPEADDILFGSGIAVVPDILANAGGVTVSTFEWEQNLASSHWSEEEVFERLLKIMSESAEHVYMSATEHRTDLRRGAFILALSRLEQAIEKKS